MNAQMAVTTALRLVEFVPTLSVPLIVRARLDSLVMDFIARVCNGISWHSVQVFLLQIIFCGVFPLECVCFLIYFEKKLCIDWLTGLLSTWFNYKENAARTSGFENWALFEIAIIYQRQEEIRCPSRMTKCFEQTCLLNVTFRHKTTVGRSFKWW